MGVGSGFEEEMGQLLGIVLLLAIIGGATIFGGIWLYYQIKNLFK